MSMTDDQLLAAISLGQVTYCMIDLAHGGRYTYKRWRDGHPRPTIIGAHHIARLESRGLIERGPDNHYDAGEVELTILGKAYLTGEAFEDGNQLELELKDLDTRENQPERPYLQ